MSIRAFLSRLHDHTFRCASCGALVEERHGFCSDACEDNWRDATAY